MGQRKSDIENGFFKNRRRAGGGDGHVRHILENLEPDMVGDTFQPHQQHRKRWQPQPRSLRDGISQKDV